MNRGSTGSRQAFQVDVDRLAEGGRLRIVVADGFEIMVPLERVCGYGAEASGSEGVWLKIAAEVGDTSGTYHLEFESTSFPNTSRDALLELLNTEVGSQVIRSRFRRPPPEPEPAAPVDDGAPSDPPGEPPPPEASQASRVRHSESSRPGPERPDAGETPPPPPLKGPWLAADEPGWLMLWPLDDTVALSRGELIPPPGSA